MEDEKGMEMLRNALLFCCCVIIAVYFSACGTWEVKFGVSEYNGSAETRTYKASDERR